MHTPTDAELVARARDGEREAFGQLSERHRSLARHIARDLVRDPDAAEELVQEALMQAYLSLKSLRQPEHFRAWLLVILRNLCRQHLSARKDRALSLDALPVRERQPDPDYFHCQPPSPYQYTEDLDLYRRVLAAVNTLSDNNRQATVLFYYERPSPREIAAHLGVSVGAVKSCLFRARRQLAELLAPIYPDYIAPAPRSDAMIRLSIADIVPCPMQGYNAVMLLDEAGRRVLPLTVSQRNGALIKAHLQPSHPPVEDRAKILVVEDDYTSCALLCSILSEAGYDVIEAYNGRDGLERAERERPDLIITDLMMPVMDGFELCRRVKANEAGGPVPFIIVLSTREDSGKALQFGADDFLTKPFDRQDLFARINALLDLRSDQLPPAASVDGFAAELLQTAGVALEDIRLEWLYEKRLVAIAKIRNGDATREVETWPETALALAARAGCPVYAREEVLASVARSIPDELQDDPAAQLQALANFVYFQHIPMTDALEQTIRRAGGEARRLHSTYVMSEHLLLALLAEIDDDAREHLEAQGLDPTDLKAWLETRFNRNREYQWGADAGDRPVPFAATAQETLAGAVRASDYGDGSTVGTRHLLLALDKIVQRAIMHGTKTE